MSSSLDPSKIDPKDIPTLAPDVVVTRADHVVVKPESDGKTAASAAQKGAGAAGGAGAKAPPVDATFRATSTDPAKKGARKSFGRRLLRGVVGVILAACVAGAAMLWQSHGEVVRQIVTKSVAPIVLALLSRESPAVEPPSGPPVVQASVVPGASVPSAPQNAADNPGSSAASSSPEAAQLLQSLTRELTNLRQDMEQMKAAIAELKASDDLMAREIAKASDKATDKALEQALRPRVSMVSPPQPVAVPVRKPPSAPQAARPVPTRPVAAAPQAAAYVPRASESRAAAPPPPSVAAPPMNLSAPPRPPASLREQTP